MFQYILLVLFIYGTIYSTPVSTDCPSDQPAVFCATVPCDVTLCPCFTDAICRNDYCGGCNAKFYVGSIEVTNNCHLCAPDKLRLLGGTSNDGIVELYVNGAWQKLCTAWRFSDNEAGLICRELGFKRGLSLFVAAYGPMSGKYSAPLTGCNGGEDSISNCTFDKDSTLCLHQNTFYASVVCFNETDQPAITDRLENDSNDTSYGYVTLYRRNIWGQVCSSYWSDLDADVFCRQMSYKGGYALKYKATPGVAFVKTAVNCNGTESNIEQCETENQICYDNYIAGALCFKSKGLVLSLKDGGSSFGRVEVTFDGETGSFCNIGWTDDDGEIVCRQLGFETGTIYYGTLPPGTGQIYLSNIQCSQYEDSILMCDSSGWKNVTDPKCLDHSNDTGVYCYKGVRLAGGKSSDGISMGRVEVYQKVHLSGFGYWSTVCAENFDQVDADVVCRQLDYERAKVLSPGTFGRAVYTSFTTSINCSGSETSLLDCPHETGSRCKYSDYASVLCTMDGIINDFEIFVEKKDSGKVIVKQYGVNGTICREGWDDNDADVVCRSQGYKGGHVFGTLRSYTRYQPIWLTNVDCKGTESSLQECKVKFDVSTNCSRDYYSAGVLCYKTTGLQTRIVDGFTDHTGRLEVSRDNMWGTVCDNSWSTYDSRVSCRELGFADGIGYRGSYHGPGTGPIYLDGLQCDGTEKSIFNCPNNGWNLSSTLCRNHTKDAGVFCYRWVVLSQTASLYGSVHIWRDDIRYGHVCSDGFDDKAAQVVCREMGYNLAIPLCCSSFGPSSLPYVMSDVKCTGNENTIRKCQHESANPVCSSSTYASVVCASSIPQGGWIVRSLISNSGLGYGYVQVNYFNQLGLICSEGFDDNEAKVICKENGYITGYAYKHNTTSRQFSHSIRWLSNITCKGTESRLADCGNLNWGQTGVWSYLSAAGIICVHSQDITSIKTRLTNGTTVEGRVELKMESLWQSVCSDTLTHREASVLCRSQGFLDGVLLAPGKYGNGSYIKIDGITCTGNENTIKDCILATTRNSVTCNLGAAAIKCYTNIRLTGSDLVEYGRLEMFNGTGWDAVCDDGFDDKDANVVCRYMGYIAGKSQCCSRLGILPSTTRIAITNFGCNGGESKPQDCTFVNGSCSSGHYVTVLCISKFTGEDLSVRLPLDSFYGPVQVRRYGLWGYVCDEGWNDRGARVVCKQLGFVSGYAVRTRIDDRTPVIMGNVSCLGTEANVDHCSRTKFGEDHGCFSRETVAGVICTNVEVGGIQFNIKGSLAKITVDNSPLYIDSLNFDNLDASVFCKSMSYAGGSTALYGGRLEVSVIDLNCTGNENSLLNCKAFWDPRKAKTNMPAGVKCHKGVRLSSGGNIYGNVVYGIVEVYRNNSWGSICNQQFDDTEAELVCRELDMENGISLCCSPFGYVSSPHSVTSVQCSGSESKFSDCRFTWADKNAASTSVCDVPWDYSSVVCYNEILDNFYGIRLSGNSYTGDVILTFMHIPGRICADGWDDNDARVACRQMNYQSGSAYNHYVEDGPRTHGPYWTSNVGCIGTEQNIGQCSKTQFGKVTSCTSRHYAGVVCYNDEELFYRLIGGDGQYGRVEVNLFDQWGSICDTHWDQREAQVFCGQRGYKTGDPYYGQYKISGSGSVYETQFECSGKESDLNKCPHGRWEKAISQRCLRHENDAGVFCYKSVKLHNGIGRETLAGAVLFYKYGQWNLICDEGFTHNSAKIVCKDLGFIDGRADCCSSYGQLGWQLLSNQTIKCAGDEPDVATCTKEESCNSQAYASVSCYNYVLPPPTEPSTKTTKTTMPTLVPTGGTQTQTNNTTTIIAVVVILLVLIIIILVVVIIFKWRRSLKHEHAHERFHDDILEHAHDGSVRVQNPLHELPDENPDELTIKSGGTVAYLPNPCENPASFSNPTYAKTEPNKTIINVTKGNSPSGTELEYASLGLSTSDKSPIYDNITNSERPEILSNDSVKLSLAENAEIHSPDHTEKHLEWPSSSSDKNDDKRTEL